MRMLLVALVALPSLWSGYWVYGAHTKTRMIEHWLDARAADGWVVEVAQVATRGFPTRFDTRLDALELADPRTGVAALLPGFDILTPSLRPTEVTLVWPEQQVLAFPDDRVEISAAAMRAEMALAPDRRLGLRRASLLLEAAELRAESGWVAGLARGSIESRETAGRPLHHDVSALLQGYRPPEPLRRLFDPAGVLPETIARMEFEATMGFDRPLDIRVLERARPGITAIELRNLRASWGDLDLRAAGRLSVDADGWPEGRISLQATNWREMLSLAVQAGMVPEPFAPSLERGLEVLARLSGNPGMIDAPLVFANRRAAIGPIPIGPAPRIVLR